MSATSPQVPHLPDLNQAAPDAVIDGRRIFFVWHPAAMAATTPSIPRGALIEHGDQANHRCVVWLPWASGSEDETTWTLLSLRPLSVAEPFCCGRCGARGGLRDGFWTVT